MLRHLFAAFASLLVLTACGSSGSSSTGETQAAGRVVVVVDTRAGEEAQVQFQVASIEVQVGPGTYIERRAAQGGGRLAISLSEVQPGVDRAWIRGTVTGPSSLDASWIRVREQ